MRIDVHTHTYFQDFADYLAARNDFPNVVIRDGQLITACSPAFSIASPPGHREVEAKLAAMREGVFRCPLQAPVGHNRLRGQQLAELAQVRQSQNSGYAVV